MLLFRAVAWAMVLPGTVTVVVPYLIVFVWRPAQISKWEWHLAPAVVLILIGAGILLYCIGSFAVVGRGTLSAVDPPRHLVVRGLYHYVRNPMYVGIVTILLGEAGLFKSRVLLGYAAICFVVFNLFVIFYEEPALRHQFGTRYDDYCRSVSRWLPRKIAKPEPNLEKKIGAS